MKCRDVMSPSVVSARPDDSVRHARRIMRAKRIHALPIVDARGKPLGMITTTDLIVEVSPSLPISRLMSSSLISIPASKDIREAARMMREYNFHHLVVTTRGTIAGMLSAFDLLEALEGSDELATRIPRKRSKPTARRAGTASRTKK